MADWIEKWTETAKTVDKESTHVDFKAELDTTSKAEWCEIIKDIIALANSGGGVILIGITDSGEKSAGSLQRILEYDPSKLTDKIYKYTNTQYSTFEIRKVKRGDYFVAAILLGPAFPPMVTTKPGTYEDPHKPKRQKTAFSTGVLFFRHGAKSEPANSQDISHIFDGEMQERRNKLFGDIRKVIEAPHDHLVHVVPAESIPASGTNSPKFRVTTDKDEKAVRVTNPDEMYPHRQKEVVMLVNKGLSQKDKINAYDIQTIVYAKKLKSKPEFIYQPKFGSAQYSDHFIEWVLQERKMDSQIFKKARRKYYKEKIAKT